MCKQPSVDLETWRVQEGLSYEQLAEELALPRATQARRYALGERWPDPEMLDRIECKTGGAVTILAMHQRRSRWLRENRGNRQPRVRVVD